MNKPGWLDKKIDFLACRRTKRLARELSLSTVCEEARCPNISECFKQGTATFMILGDICTRDCRFCSVSKGRPRSVDLSETVRVKEAVQRLGLEYVVLTSPTRDDLADGGAAHFSRIIRELRTLPRVKKVEVLIPDLAGDRGALEILLQSRPDVIGHNLETVPSLYAAIRSKADYRRSLSLLAEIKKRCPSVYTKSGLMLGLGEEDREIKEVLGDLRRSRCDFLSLGQYLPPSRKHYPVQKYISPEKFEYWRDQALSLGFVSVLSAPYVRSSYLAHTYLEVDSQ